MRLTGRPRIIARILVQIIPVTLLVLLLNFALMQLAPGDIVDVILFDSGIDDEEVLQRFRDSLGIGGTVIDRARAYFTNLAHFDLGRSLIYNVPVLDLVLSRLGYTVGLMLAAFLLSVVIGSLLGTVMAVTAGSWIDRSISAIVVVLYSTPSFGMGLLLIVVFAVHLGWLPSSGAKSIGSNDWGVSGWLDSLRHLILPAIAAASFHIAVYARLLRSSILEVIAQDYVRTAVAKGLSPAGVLVRHVLRNALLPVASYAGMHLGSIASGAVVVETIFGWPGMGRLLVEAVDFRDYPVLLGVILVASLIVIIVNMCADIVQTYLDPRIVLR